MVIFSIPVKGRINRNDNHNQINNQIILTTAYLSNALQEAIEPQDLQQFAILKDSLDLDQETADTILQVCNPGT